MTESTRTYDASSWQAPLRIAMVAACPFPTHQGTQVFIRHLATALAGAGHEVHLFAYGEGDTSAEESGLYFLHRAHRVGVGPRSGPQVVKPLADASLFYTCHRALKSRPFDIIHAHHVEGLAVAAALGRMNQLPVVYHIHNALGSELPSYFRRPGVRRLTAWLGEVADRSLPQLAEAVITFDEDHRALQEMYGVSESRLHVIPPGLSPHEIRGAQPTVVTALREHLGEGPWVLYAGNPDGYQNLPLLWQAYKKVRARRPEVGLLVATHHPPSAFESVLPPKNQRKGIRIFQHRDLEELRAAFALADVGVCPRVMWTGAPIKVLNYMAAGLPVVACRDSVRHILPSSLGLAVAADPEVFAQSILKILKKPIMRHHPIGHAFDRFRIEAQVGLYENVYRSVLRG